MRKLRLLVLTVALSLTPFWWTAGASTQSEGQPAAKSKKFELRIVRLRDTYQGFRFRPDTGESWQISKEGWIKMAEADPVPVAKYDLLLVTTEENLTVFRVDRASGHTWQLQARLWVKYDEPSKDDAKPKAPAPAEGKSYDFRQVRVGNTLHIVRFDTKSGATWHLRGNEGYEPLGETGAVGAGDYDVTMVATEKTWMAFRINRATGASWLLRQNTWYKVKEPEPD